MTQQEKDLAHIRIVGLDKWLDYNIHKFKVKLEAELYQQASVIVFRQNFWYFNHTLGIVIIEHASELRKSFTDYIIGIDPYDKD